MGTTEVLLRYDGPALADHSMDVSDLAPALLSFGNLCKEANKVLNGDRASVRVLVKADIQANCVTISLDVVQTLMEHIRTLIHNDNVKDAQTIFDWLGIIGATTTATAGAIRFGLFQFLKLRSSRKIESATEIKDSDGNNLVEIKFVGDHITVIILPEVKKLADSYDVVKNAKGVIAPVAENQGVETAEFVIDELRPQVFDKDDSKAIASVSMDDESEPQYIIGHITVHSVVFDNRSKKWKFHYNGHVEEIDISDTSIAENAIKRKKAVLGDTYKVKLRIVEKRTKKGDFKYEYKVVEVLEFIEGNEQTEMDFNGKKQNTDS